VTAEQAGRGEAGQKPRPRSSEGSRKRPKKTSRKSVLNVTISESLAEEVRMTAALGHTTISSVVEKALADQMDWELTRQRGLAAMDAYYREHGYPTAEEREQADADVAEEERLIHEAQAEMGDQDWMPPAWYVEALWPGWWGGK
jgi:post-segregation antitoxin (ccd killing protein)